MSGDMQLTVLLPTGILPEGPAQRVRAEGAHGTFSVLPRHIDCVVDLVSCLLSYRDGEGKEHHLAVDGGTLVKRGNQVLVSTPNGMAGEDLETLRRTIAERFEKLDERERRAQAALEKMEADFIRRFIEAQHHA